MKAQGLQAATETARGDSSRVRFGDFEFDPERRELFRDGRPVAIRDQSLRILALLVRNADRIVTRREIQESVWDPDTHVDFDQGINHCIRQIRSVLEDAADDPRFVETIPRRGYRFVAAVETVGISGAPAGLRRYSVGRLVLLAVGLILAGAFFVLRFGPQSVEGTPVPPVLAVLPFQDLSGSDSLLGDSLTEELISQIGRRYAGRMGVIARTSAMQFKDTAVGIEEISRDLGADYVLEGSVRRAGERIRITAQLVRASDESHLWSSNFDRTIEDVIDLQEEVSDKIATSLGLKLLPGEALRHAEAKPAAYASYLAGKARFYSREPGTPEGHIEILERSVSLDPGFAPAWALLADARRLLPVPPLESMERAREAVERALALDESLPQAHLTLAKIHFYFDWDLAKTRRSLQRAIEIHPGFAEAWHAFAAYYSVTGQHDEARSAIRKASALDPLSPLVTSDVGWYSYYAGDYEQAIEHCRESLQQDPYLYWGHRCIIYASLKRGDREGALAQMRDDMRHRDATDEELARLEVADADAAIEAYWAWDIGRLEGWAQDQYLSPSAFGQIHLARGDHGRALDAFEQAVRERSGWILPYLRIEPMAERLRDDARFRDLLDSIERPVAKR